MREHKYRGWHTTQKRMFSCEEMVSDQLTLLPDGRFINVNSASTSLSVIYPKDKFIPLQYTGLKDKNGKEIYEGDIVEYKDILSDEFAIDKNSNLIGVINWYEEKAGLVIQQAKENYRGGHYICNWDMAMDIEIIGNIYENPEFLTQ